MLTVTIVATTAVAAFAETDEPLSIGVTLNAPLPAFSQAFEAAVPKAYSDGPTRKVCIKAKRAYSKIGCD